MPAHNRPPPWEEKKVEFVHIDTDACTRNSWMSYFRYIISVHTDIDWSCSAVKVCKSITSR